MFTCKVFYHKTTKLIFGEQKITMSSCKFAIFCIVLVSLASLHECSKLMLQIV